VLVVVVVVMHVSELQAGIKANHEQC